MFPAEGMVTVAICPSNEWKTYEYVFSPTHFFSFVVLMRCETKTNVWRGVKLKQTKQRTNQKSPFCSDSDWKKKQKKKNRLTAAKAHSEKWLLWPQKVFKCKILYLIMTGPWTIRHKAVNSHTSALNRGKTEGTRLPNPLVCFVRRNRCAHWGRNTFFQIHFVSIHMLFISIKWSLRLILIRLVYFFQINRRTYGHRNVIATDQINWNWTACDLCSTAPDKAKLHSVCLRLDDRWKQQYTVFTLHSERVRQTGDTDILPGTSKMATQQV